MLTHRGFSAWVVSEGTSIEEHLVAVDSKAHRVSCWIPCEPGKTFAVHWSDEGSKVTSCAFIILDGFTVPGRFLFGEGSASREGIRTGGLTERPFVFAQHDNSEYGKPGEPNRDVGMIVLKVKRVHLCGNRPANKVLNIPDLNQGRNQIGGVCVRYGDERKTFEQHPTTWQVKAYDEDNNRSYVTFVFRYRSREFLQAQGIMSEEKESKSAQKAVPPKRRVAPITTTLTPSPSPSPTLKKMEAKLDRMSPSLRQAFYPSTTRPRTTHPSNYRTVSTRSADRNDRYPGEGLILFDSSSPPKDADTPQTESTT